MEGEGQLGALSLPLLYPSAKFLFVAPKGSTTRCDAASLLRPPRRAPRAAALPARQCVTRQNTQTTPRQPPKRTCFEKSEFEVNHWVVVRKIEVGEQPAGAGEDVTRQRGWRLAGGGKPISSDFLCKIELTDPPKKGFIGKQRGDG